MRRAGSLLAALCAAVLVTAAPAQAAPTPMVVLFGAGAGTDIDAAISQREKSLGFSSSQRYRSAARGFSAPLTSAQTTALRADPAVQMVVPDTTFTANGAEPVATGETVPAGIRRIGAATLTSAATAAPAGVAVLDTGIDLANPDLNVRNGVNCVSTSSAANDDNGHGTHVAGTVAARNAGTGVLGVAPATTLFSVKVLNAKATGSLSQILCGLDWVSKNAATLGIRVVNMSLSGSGKDDGNCGRSNNDAEHVAICGLAAAGVTVVASAGNTGKAFSTAIPAAYREVLTVTAMNDADGLPGAKAIFAGGCKSSEKDDRYATTSSFAATTADAAHVIAAPGTCVLSTKRGGGTVYMSGTSMSAPHVAGAVARCVAPLAPCDGLAPADVITRMRDLAAAVPAGSGFVGDPRTPVSGKTFGYLVSSAF